MTISELTAIINEYEISSTAVIDDCTQSGYLIIEDTQEKTIVINLTSGDVAQCQ